MSCEQEQRLGEELAGFCKTFLAEHNLPLKGACIIDDFRCAVMERSLVASDTSAAKATASRRFQRKTTEKFTNRWGE